VSELTPSDALGSGVAVENLWDFEVQAGSIGVVDGLDALGRDLAFGTIHELDELRGERLTPDLAAEIEIVVRRVANRDDRVSRVVPPIEVTETDDGATAEVALTVVATTGERGEYVLTV
jgi:hypothetical protein